MHDRKALLAQETLLVADLEDAAAAAQCASVRGRPS
jgi:hypothetical protein